MFLSVLYAICSCLLDLLLPRAGVERACQVELLALRHEVRVLRRQIKRTRWGPADRLVLTALSHCFPRSAWGRLPVRPETLLRWLWGTETRSRGALGTLMQHTAQSGVPEHRPSRLGRLPPRQRLS
jgi:hypothetical protein